ncbi:MAG: DDE-type integrase/transposase/recombinase [Acidobacteriota bacterium]
MRRNAFAGLAETRHRSDRLGVFELLSSTEGFEEASWACAPSTRSSESRGRLRSVVEVSLADPWWGYKRIAVICRRAKIAISNRFVYRVLKEANLLQWRRPKSPELYQAARLFELLPQKSNDLWQADVTYIHIPGHGWWYAVTVIDYFSRYLLALHLSPSNDAGALTIAIDQAFAEAERVHGPLEHKPTLVTDNGSNFIARRFHKHIKDLLDQVRTRYRTPQQLGLLERFHQTLKQEEVYWDIY